MIHAAPERATPLVVRTLEGGAMRRSRQPRMDSYSWSPDSREIAYSSAPRTGFTAPYETRLYAVPAEGGTPRIIVDRTGMNVRPQFSPDGRSIAFVSTDGRSELMAPRSLTVVPASGGASRLYLMDGAWINELVWARDSNSIYFQARRRRRVAARR